MKKSSRRPLIAGNWKMHKTVAESLTLVRELRSQTEGGDKVEVVVAPPFTALHAVAQELAGSRIEVAGQNCHWEPQGAYTGEVSASMLREAGARFVILGHSERRQFFGETDESVNRKVRVALAVGLHPIVCVGETLAEREAGHTVEVVSRQLHGALANLSPKEAAGLVLAYEPVWAIGTGRTATAHQAQEVHLGLRRLLVELVGGELSEATRILYGGSVKPDNAAELLAQADVDGALVGGASLKAGDFTAILRAAS